VQVGAQGEGRVYAKPLDDGSLAVGLFNLGPTEARVTATWADLNLSGPRQVRDLWRQQDLGAADAKFEATVAPHGVMLVRLMAAP